MNKPNSAYSINLLVRVKHNRNITEEPFKLFEGVRKAPVSSVIQIHIPRKSVRSKKSKQKASPGRPERMADLAIRYMHVSLPPAHYHSGKEPIELRIVHALE